jgi:hypothetical protein
MQHIPGEIGSADRLDDVIFQSIILKREKEFETGRS